jgi:hypothetical protein
VWSLSDSDGGYSGLSQGSGVWVVAWTWQGRPGVQRTYLQFSEITNLAANKIPKSATITFLYHSGAFCHNNPADPYNQCPTGHDIVIRRLTSSLNNTISWSKQPSVTDVNKIIVSTLVDPPTNTTLKIDITQLVSDMLSTNQNFGLLFALVDETYYKRTFFRSGTLNLSF